MLLVSDRLAPQQPVRVEHGIDGVPILCQDDGASPAVQVRKEHRAQRMGSQGTNRFP
jgi:hypothetical protein